MKNQHRAQLADASDGKSGSEKYVQIDDEDALIRRRLLIATGAVGGTGIVISSFPFINSMMPSAKARAEGGPTEVDISSFRPGELHTVVWRSKPVWILKRDPQMLASIQNDRNLLADPNSQKSEQPTNCQNSYRALQADLAVIVGVCTHLGCTPNMRPISAAGTGSLGANWPGGFFCPCHGSKFDLAGRVFKNVPAPTNLEIPPYVYLSSTTLRIGNENT